MAPRLCHCWMFRRMPGVCPPGPRASSHRAVRQQPESVNPCAGLGANLLISIISRLSQLTISLLEYGRHLNKAKASTLETFFVPRIRGLRESAFWLLAGVGVILLLALLSYSPVDPAFS